METVLHSFAGGADGLYPRGRLAFDSAGNLYGTTAAGGPSSACSGGCGTVFKLTPSGKTWTESVIYSFSQTDGAFPRAGVISDAVGNLYGTTFLGGNKNNGVVFRLAFSNGTWTETVLYAFDSTLGDGRDPSKGLLLDPAGSLYGTTSVGTNGVNHGTVFKLTPSPSGPWTETVLYAFPLTSGSLSSGLLWNVGQTSLFGTTGPYSPTALGTTYQIKLP